MYRFLIHIADVRPSEARQALGFFCYFFLLTLSIYILKPVKENFLIGITPAWWPYADFITAGLIGFVVACNDRYAKRLSMRSYISRITVFFAVSLLFLWAVFEAGIHGGAGIGHTLVRRIWPIPVFVLSFWTDIFIVTSLTHFWFAVNDLFSLHQAKRIVSFFVMGGLLGGITGSLLTARLVQAMGPVNLLLVCPPLFLCRLAVIRSLYYGHEKSARAVESHPARPGYGNVFEILQADRYLQLLAGLFASGIVLACLIQYQFKIVIKAAIPNDGARTSFLGSFFLAILLLSALFHMLTTGQVLKRFGIRLGLLLAPAVLLLLTLSVFVVPASGLILWACLLRGCEKTFDCTLNQSVRELLYMPIPASIKYRAKIFIDMFLNKLSVGLGAILFWILSRAGSYEHKTPEDQVQQISIVAGAVAIVSIALVWNIYKEYMGALKRDLSIKWQDAHRVLADRIDLDAARLVADTLQSREKSSTLYAMNLFQLIRKEKLSPDMLACLSHKEEELRLDSMDSLFDVPVHSRLREIEETLADANIVAEVQKIVALESYESIMESRLETLVRNADASEVERMEAARLIGILRMTPGVRQCLDRLLRDASPNVLLYALDSAAVHHCRECVPAILRLLGEPAVMPAAQDALASYGSGIEEILRIHLRDPGEKWGVRIAIPEILARIETQTAVDILTEELVQGPEEMKQSIIDALYTMHSRKPAIPINRDRILAAVFSRIARSYEAYLADYDRTLSGERPVPDPAQKAEADIGMGQIFDLLTLIYPREDIVRAYQNMQQGTRRSFDSSLELLDNVLQRDLKLFLFPLLEDLPPEYKAQRLRRVRRTLDRRLY